MGGSNLSPFRVVKVVATVNASVSQEPTKIVLLQKMVQAMYVNTGTLAEPNYGKCTLSDIVLECADSEYAISFEGP